jgi:hypothetical protein
MLRERKNMKLYRYFTEEDIEEYKIEDGKIYDEKSRIQSFAYINKDDVLPDAFILDSFKIYEVDLFGEKYFPDEYSSKIYANKLQILNEVNYEKFCNKIFNECTQEQLQVIKLKTDEILNKAITSEYNNCRAAVAIVGRDCDLDKLVYDKSEFVQSMVLSHKRPQDIKTLINNSNTKKEILLKIAEFDLDDECFEMLLKRNYNAVIRKLFNRDSQRVLDFYKKENNNCLSNEIIQSIIVNLTDQNIVYELRKKDDSETKLLLLKTIRSCADAMILIVDEDEDVRKLAFEILQDPENAIEYREMIKKIL